MPIVGVPTARLEALLGRRVSRKRLAAALEQIGCHPEGYARLTRHQCGSCGQTVELLEHEEVPGACPACGAAALGVAGTVEVVRIELLPVRPDMFDVAGLSRALRGYLGFETGLPEFRVAGPGCRIRVEPGLEAVRPNIVAAVVRGVEFDEETVRVVMKMQENLHWALGRDRRLASIGVYDLGTVAPDFVYRPVEPDGVRFVPLFGMPGRPSAEATPNEILANHPKGRAYRHLLERHPVYPLLTDSRGRVLSLPPIINSDETRVSAKTRDVLIDVTGPDRNAITKSLNVVVTALVELGGAIEQVEVRLPDGGLQTTPDLTPRRVIIDTKRAARVIGVRVGPKRIAAALEKMRYGARAEGKQIEVDVPAYRCDIMHEYDVIEDIAIGYGYERIRPRLVPTMTVGRPLPVEELAEKVRRAMTGLGYFEVMTSLRSNPREQFHMLRQQEQNHAVIDNPLSVEQTMPRVHLLSALLGTFRENVTRPLPQRVFEVGECYALDATAETGVRTRLVAGVGIIGPTAGFADGRSLVAALTRELLLEAGFAAAEHPTFIPGRAARVEAGGRAIGVLGEVHPEVLENFALGQPTVLCEIDLDQLLEEHA